MAKMVIRNSELIMNDKETIQESDTILYGELDKAIAGQIESTIKELNQLKIDKTKIGDPKALSYSISQIVWEQFILEVAGSAGSDFIKSNRNLNLSLKKADHYLNENDFYKGKRPTHNFQNSATYNQRREKYFSNFKLDEKGKVITHKTRTGAEEATLAAGARKPYDKGRPIGSKRNKTSIDHIVSVGEILRDKSAGAFLDENEKLSFANSNTNLNEIPRDWNASKTDMKTTEWLNTANAKGQKPDEIFDISESEKDKLLRKDEKAREVWNKTKNKGEQRAKQEGHASRVDELRRSTQYTLQAVAIALMAKFTKTIFEEVIGWLFDNEHEYKALKEQIKKAIKDFILDFKNNVLLSIDVSVTVISAQIFGEIIPILRKSLLFLTIGGKTIINVVKYFKKPENDAKETATKAGEIGEIVINGLTAAGSVALGTVITLTLAKCIPPLATFQIPRLGSAADLLGIFFGGLASGICGAIVLNQIEGMLSAKMIDKNNISQLVKIEKVLTLQNEQFKIYNSVVLKSASDCKIHIISNFSEAKNVLEEIKSRKDEPVKSDNEQKFNDLSNLIDNLD